MVQAPRPNAGHAEKKLENQFFPLKKIKITPQKIFLLHISSSYAKILGETNFHTQEFPRSGSKAKDREKKKKEKKRE